jgi:hypothetical protein
VEKTTESIYLTLSKAVCRVLSLSQILGSDDRGGLDEPSRDIL